MCKDFLNKIKEILPDNTLQFPCTMISMMKLLDQN